MPENDDPRRPSYTAFMKHRIGMTKRKSKKIEKGLHKYIYDTTKVSKAMEDLVKFFSIYGTEESGETGAMLRVFAKVLSQANSHREVRRTMLSNVGTNLSHLKNVYREAKETMKEYKAAQARLKAAKKKYVTRRRLIGAGKMLRKAKCAVERRESEFFAKKREIKKVLDGFDKKLRKALLRTFFQFIRCEMFMAARMLETFSESYSKLERWNAEIKELRSRLLEQSAAAQDETNSQIEKAGGDN